MFFDMPAGFSNRRWVRIPNVENVIVQLVHTSAVGSSRYEALGKFGEHSRS